MPDYISLALTLEVRQNLLILEGQRPGTGRQKKSNIAYYFETPSAFAPICSAGQWFVVALTSRSASGAKRAGRWG